MPRVSVLLPARNAEATIRPAVRSILRQTFRDLELVVVDDGSTDATAAILAEEARGDRRLRVLRGPAQGIVAALEAGRAACDCELVARMDADDVAHPLRLAEQIERLDREPALDGLGCSVAMFPPQQVGQGMRLYVNWLNSLHEAGDVARERFVESPLVHPAALLRARALETVGGYVERGWPEDYDLWLRLMGHGMRLANLPAVRLFWRDHGERLTRTDPRYGKARHLALKAHHLARGPLAERRNCAIWGAGKTGKALARALEAEGIAVEWWVDVAPAKVGGVARGAPIYGQDDFPKGGPLLLVAVAARGARALIRKDLLRAGRVEGRDFLVCW